MDHARQRAWMLAAAACVVAAGLAAFLAPGAGGGVEPPQAVPGRSDFRLVDHGVNRLHGPVTAAAASAAPTEMEAAPPLAHTAAAAEDLVYLVLVEEEFPGSVTGARFTAELLADGASLGTLAFAQDLPDPGGVAGVRLMWSLGTAPDPDARYEVRLAQAAP